MKMVAESTATSHTINPTKTRESRTKHREANRSQLARKSSSPLSSSPSTHLSYSMALPPAKKAKLAAAPVQISADSLEEDFLLEDGFAPSDDEGDLDPALLDVTDSQDGNSLIPALSTSDTSDVETDSPPAQKKTKGEGKKRKADAGGEEKKAEDKEKAKSKKKAKLSALGIGTGEDEGMGLLPPASLADRLAEKQARALPNLSGIEMDDLRILGEISLYVR
jgi:protein CMS1